jgi:hypothetical protein
MTIDDGDDNSTGTMSTTIPAVGGKATNTNADKAGLLKKAMMGVEQSLTATIEKSGTVAASCGLW